MNFRTSSSPQKESCPHLQPLLIPSSPQPAAAKSRQSCPTLCDPTDGSPPGSPVPGILQARTLEWAAISFSNAWKWKVKVKSLSHVRLLAIPWTAAYQAPLSMGVSRQEYRSGLPAPSPLQPRQPLIFFPSPRFCLSWTFCTNEIRQSVTFCAWLLALKIIMSGFTHVAAWIST